MIQEFFHGVFALPFAYLIWKKTKDWRYFFLVIFFAYAIDVDHLFDYFLYYGFHFNLFEFLSAKYFESSGHAFVPLHAWEWVIILGIIAKNKGWKSIYAIVCLGFTAHLIFDAISIESIAFYSIIYRALSGFTNL